jgi:RNA polymerase sigma-70 factor (ECF subfamily)
MSPTGWPEAERAAREAYGRLVAWLAWQWRDLAAAEDAMAEALLAALTHWPRDGVPSSPDAWLLTTARRHLLMQQRRQRLADSPEVQALLDSEPTAPEPAALPDRRLELLFACAHPALTPTLHAPLMMQAVLGLEAAAIARAFLVAPSAMAQRLVRAKAKIREAGIAFSVPEPSELPARLGAVLESIYGAYTVASDRGALAPEAEAPLREEALFLARLVASALPGQAEALGLLALLLYCEARRPAQFDAEGQFVPLMQQDTARWDRALLQQGEGALWQASQLRSPGTLQLEAAIQSAHCQRAYTGRTPWDAIAQLYELLVTHQGSLGAHIGHAVACAESGQAERALALLMALREAHPEPLRSHQPFWVALAHLQRLAGQDPAEALGRALGLTADERVRRFLRRSYGLPA